MSCIMAALFANMAVKMSMTNHAGSRLQAAAGMTGCVAVGAVCAGVTVRALVGSLRLALCRRRNSTHACSSSRGRRLHGRNALADDAQRAGGAERCRHRGAVRAELRWHRTAGRHVRRHAAARRVGHHAGHVPGVWHGHTGSMAAEEHNRGGACVLHVALVWFVRRCQAFLPH